MTSRAVISLTMSALVFGGTTVGCTAGPGSHIASASDRNPAAADRQAAANAGQATKALASGKADKAVASAEAAVVLRPHVADYRVLLGQSYLKAGRFASAHAAFADALVLAADNGKAALNLALSQTAEGQGADARRTLDAHAATIAPGDRGLALALAGDPAGGVQLLMQATRSSDANAKTRQNLALALALAGRWQDARAIVSVDLPADQVDKRLLQWAAFAKPHSSSDQVAALLGVTPVRDAGQPFALALADPTPAVALAQADATVAEVAPATVVASDPAPVATAIRFAPRQEVVQALPAQMIAAPTTAARVRVAAAEAAPSSGDWYVQLGAYENAGVARDGWARARARFAGFRSHTPTGMSFTAAGHPFYRLSVGGFAHAQAVSMCQQYRARGGECFVRVGAGDQVAGWVRAAGAQVASR